MTFVMFGTYSSEAIKEIDSARTARARKIVGNYGGKVKAIYALLGKPDLLFVLELPGIEEAVRVSVALTKETGIAFQTSPALSVQEFDKIVVSR